MAQLIIPPQPVVLTPPSGASTLPLVELDEGKVKTERRQVRLRKGSKKRKEADCSFGNFVGSLPFTAWEFFHAAKKSELASSFSAAQADRRAFAFAFEHEETFIWNTSNFRKTDSAVFALEDFASSGLAGRVGEAVAYLTMVKRGYIFWDRCATVWERAARQAKISHAEQLQVARYVASRVASGRPQNEPDFVFEKSNGEVALMEAKGSFVDPVKDNPSAKGDLRQALTQLAAWSGVIVPVPEKSFAIGTYLREEQDNGDDPSLIAFVDPPGEEILDFTSVRLPPDLIRRCNYGAWLTGMGLLSAGRSLRDSHRKAVEVISLPVVEVANHKFAVVPLGWEPLAPERAMVIEPWWSEFAPLRPWVLSDSLFVMGIEVEVLQTLGEAIHGLDPAALKQIKVLEYAELSRATPQGVHWSIMPDGSFIGTVARDQFRNRGTFRL